MTEGRPADLPDRLYKYRSPDLDQLRKIIIDGTLWAAQPTTFNDPFDCFPFIDPRGTYDEAKKWLATRLQRTGRSMARAEFRAEARRIHREGIDSINRDGSSGPWLETVRQFGVLSLTADPLNVLMWSHYASDHKGVCLEFATDVAPFFLADQVTYSSERPVFRPLDPDRTDLMRRVLMRKANFWQYEAEWRYVRVARGSGVVAFPQAALTAVILGAAATAAFREQVARLVIEGGLSIPIRQARFDPRAYRLHLEA